MHASMRPPTHPSTHPSIHPSIYPTLLFAHECSSTSWRLLQNCTHHWSRPRVVGTNGIVWNVDQSKGDSFWPFSVRDVSSWRLRPSGVSQSKIKKSGTDRKRLINSSLSGAVTLCNFSCILFRNFVIRQVVREIASCMSLQSSNLSIYSLLRALHEVEPSSTAMLQRIFEVLHSITC